MRFWDASALVPLVIEQDATAALRDMFEQDRAVYVWWATLVECASALSREHRDGRLSAPVYQNALKVLAVASRGWRPVAPTERLRQEAIRMVRVHALKAGDALQLAAAREWSEQRPVGYHFVSLDKRLRQAAELEGFTVLPE